MGACPLDPQVRVIRNKNKELQKILHENMKGLQHYGFYQRIINAIKDLQQRYMYNEGILQDIQKIHCYSYKDSRTQVSIEQNMQEEIKNSCLILEDEQANLKQELNNKNQPFGSFRNNLESNESLVIQINIIYSNQIQKSQYSSALKLFLKWAQMLQEHSYGGLLKPLYKQFCAYIYKLPSSEFETLVDQICVFVQLMVTNVTKIYGLDKIASSQQGKLFKNQNVYNLIMSYIFKRTKIKNYLIECVRINESHKILLFQQKISRLKIKPTYFFGVQKPYLLQDENISESQINKQRQSNIYIQPYAESLKLIDHLLKNGSPVTKLKTIVAISKQIIQDIKEYYLEKQRQAPNIDPDNLSSIIMYLLAKNGNKSIYQQLKIVQNFTTTNCMNCISGYYLNIFLAAIQYLLSLEYVDDLEQTQCLLIIIEIVMNKIALVNRELHYRLFQSEPELKQTQRQKLFKKTILPPEIILKSMIKKGLTTTSTSNNFTQRPRTALSQTKRKNNDEFTQTRLKTIESKHMEKPLRKTIINSVNDAIGDSQINKSDQQFVQFATIANRVTWEKNQQLLRKKSKLQRYNQRKFEPIWNRYKIPN